MTVTVNPTTDTPLVRLYQEAAVENGWAVTDCNGANMTGALFVFKLILCCFFVLSFFLLVPVSLTFICTRTVT